MSLQETMGLSSGPLWETMGAVDEYLGQKDWFVVHRVLPPQTLLNGMYFYLGHPAKYPRVDEGEVDDFREWLAVEGETEFSEIVKNLQNKGFEAENIRQAMMYILVNLEYLKDNVGRKYRSIDSGWPFYER